VAPTNRVNVALPFSKITLTEPSDDVVELTAIVARLVDVVDGLAPGSTAAELRGRVQALAARLR